MQFFRMRKTALQRLAVYEGILMAIAVGIGLVQGRVTFESFGTTLALLGFGVFGFGILSVAGAWGQIRNFRYQHASSAGPRSIHERYHSDKQDLSDAYGFFASSAVIGSVSVAIGLIFILL